MRSAHLRVGALRLGMGSASLGLMSITRLLSLGSFSSMSGGTALSCASAHTDHREKTSVLLLVVFVGVSISFVLGVGVSFLGNFLNIFVTVVSASVFLVEIHKFAKKSVAVSLVHSI